MGEPNCILVADFTIGGLAPLLGAPPEPKLAAHVAPFGQVIPTLLAANSEFWQHDPLFTVVWTRPETAIPGFGRAVLGESIDADQISGEVESFAHCIRTAADYAGTIIVPSWTLPSYDRLDGCLTFRPNDGIGYSLLKMNLKLAESLADLASVFLLDTQRWLGTVGRAAQSTKYWHLGKVVFGPKVLHEAAKDIKAVVRAVQGTSRKLIVVDLDDTLWGGIVGDVGWQHLDLGGHSPHGEAFQYFQSQLKAFTRRGGILAIASKNSESIALEAIDQHPEMVLRRSDFATWRINWNDKAENIVDLVRELNLGLESVVFIDDSPAERARVSEALPQVFVPDWPKDKMLYGQTFSQLDCFDTAYRGDEDRSRNATYVAERSRRVLRDEIPSAEGYWASLATKVDISVIDEINEKRVLQLLNKTNQMNLATHRYDKSSFSRWIAETSQHTLIFRVADRFGDYGIVGVTCVFLDGEIARVHDFVLSCRVMGRQIEQLMLSATANLSLRLGARRLELEYIPTSRNMPCLTVLREDRRLVEVSDNNFSIDLDQPDSYPPHLTVEIQTIPQLTNLRETRDG